MDNLVYVRPYRASMRLDGSNSGTSSEALQTALARKFGALCDGNETGCPVVKATGVAVGQQRLHCAKGGLLRAASQRRNFPCGGHHAGWLGTTIATNFPCRRTVQHGDTTVERKRGGRRLRGRVVAHGRHVARQHGRRGVQACGPGPHLPEVHLRRVRRSASQTGGQSSPDWCQSRRPR